MSNPSKKKLDTLKLSSKAKKILQKRKKEIFPNLPTKIDLGKIKSKKLEITLECYRCKDNKSSRSANKTLKLCINCRQPICGIHETKKPKGYCLPCKNKIFRFYPVLE